MKGVFGYDRCNLRHHCDLVSECHLELLKVGYSPPLSYIVNHSPLTRKDVKSRSVMDYSSLGAVRLSYRIIERCSRCSHLWGSGYSRKDNGIAVLLRLDGQSIRPRLMNMADLDRTRHSVWLSRSSPWEGYSDHCQVTWRRDGMAE